jgi:UTP-glucose-1-phosphate uridylyltransferase
MKTALLVLAAGMGSRYGGIKQIDPVGKFGEAILEYSVFDAIRAGFDEVVFLIRKSIEADFRDIVLARLPPSLRVRIAFQELDSLLRKEDLSLLGARTKPWGTGHALLCAGASIEASFAVINADDFYGHSAFLLVHDFLASADPARADFCMAGYRLKNTTSSHGTVSRGVCEVGPDSYLESVTEHLKISESPYASELADGSRIGFTGEEIVSMNFFGLTPGAFSLIEPRFRDFLRMNPGPDDEFFLPMAIDGLVRGGRARLRVLETEESWFGITYKAEREGAARKIADLCAAGTYPSPLWGGRHDRS